ncbi:MAG: hypothetical protein REH83_03110, partial [Rickettsiella sp.]|nr:hypothetical protein [Rickettsiella sp.]
IKVYKNLEKHFSNDRKEDNYLFLRFSTAKRMQEKLINSFSSDRSFQLLVIECKKEVAFSELSILLNLLAEVLKRPNKQLILISRGEFEKKTIETALKSSVNEYKDIINFFELTFKSKEKLLHKSVNFQGNQFFLKELIINSFFNRNFPFEYFSKENRLSAIKIGSKITLPKNYKEKTYIYRKIIQSNQFDLKILKDTNTDKFFITGINKKKLAHFVRNTKLIASVADSLQDRNLDFKFIYDDENKAYAKEKFEKIYKQLNKIENSIHWLEYQATTKKLIWKSSQGNLVNLKRYGRENTILSEKECFTSIEQKLVILSASTGMGKSFFLASIASQIKTKNPALWVSVINLKAHIKAIESLDFSKENHVEENVKNFLKQILHIKTVFENYHFEYNFENAGLVLLFEHYESLTQIQIEKFFKLIDRLTVLNLKQIWITAKPEFLSSLEERFSSLSLQLSPLTGNEQKKLINDIWINNRALHENDKVKFDSLAANFLARVKNSIVEPKHEHSLTKPITLSLLASIMKNSFENLDKLDTSISKINEYSIFQIYRKFIIENFRKALVGLSNNKSILDDLENHAKNYLAQAAREFLFPHILRENRKIPEVVKLLTFIDVNENKIDFSHQTFAEYFYVQWLLFNKNAPNDEIKEVLEKKRSFSSFFYQFFNEQFSEGNPVSFFAVTKNKEELNLELNKINKIFFDVADSSGRTALHLVAANGDVDKFHIFYQWGMDFNKRDIQLNLTPIEHAALEKQWKFLNTVILDIKDRIEYKA